MRKLGQALLSSNSTPAGGYSETAVREDGRYAVVGTKWGADGTYLVDLSDPTVPRQVHHLPGSNGAPNLDAKFDYRNGLYYRAIERREWAGNFEVVDYGYANGAPRDPEIIGTVGGDGVKTHNLTPHPSEPVLYTQDYGSNPGERKGFNAFDVSDPAAPRKVDSYGPDAYVHGLSIDPVRELLHCVYWEWEEAFVGYVAFDASDPRAPVEVGRFDYRDRKPYSEAEIGEEAFGNAHHADADPQRDLVLLALVKEIVGRGELAL